MVVHDLRALEPVPRADRGRSQLSGRSRLAEEDRVQGAVGRAGAARLDGQLQGGRRPSVDQPLRAAAVGVAVVRSAPGRVARRGDGARQGGGRSRPSGHHHDELRGLSEGVRRIDAQSRPAAVRGDRRRLHRPRRALRELRPPDHDSFGAAFGRSRRAGHAVSLRQRAEHLLIRRTDHADRHREEERDHADRFRPRRRASASHGADRRHLRRLRHPLPSDHDDDDGGAAWRAADRARATDRAARRGVLSVWRLLAVSSSRS